jgi:hypothetical protein
MEEMNYLVIVYISDGSSYLLSIFILFSAHLTQLNQYLNPHKVNGTETTIVHCIARSLMLTSDSSHFNQTVRMNQVVPN